jgi:broad specificity phosphatase PhoE
MILIRHGQTEFNKVYGETRRDPGIEDPGLTPLGREQAIAAAETLGQPWPDRPLIRRLIASPYTRTLQTAAVIAERLGLPITVEPLVREHASFVCDVGTPRQRLAADWPHLAFDHIDECWWAPNGEDLPEVQARCAEFRAKAAGMPDWPEIAVITHWGVILALTGRQVRNGELVAFDPTAPSATIEDRAHP